MDSGAGGGGGIIGDRFALGQSGAYELGYGIELIWWWRPKQRDIKWWCSWWVCRYFMAHLIKTWWGQGFPICSILA